ncbi:hypothetical protein M3Y94_01235500 [Aphelenchoides besseyi]|nr:hypothetical protein M3Y94_01235500 [Aphelenchoides besseyi]KAI6217530.1 RNase H type-1 domain-containing protein [Aphelenchoides besseyi]
MSVAIPNGASARRSFSAPPTDRPATAISQSQQASFVQVYPIGGQQRREDELPTPRNTIVIYTDGSCVAGERSGAGAYFGPQHPLNISASLPAPHNSGLAEIWAAILALESLEKWKGFRGEAVMIRTDCMAVIDGLRKGHNGILTSALTRLRLVAQRFPHGVTFQHVYGHNNHPGNDNADELSRIGCFGNRARSVSPTAQVEGQRGRSRSKVPARNRSQSRNRSRSREGRGMPNATYTVEHKDETIREIPPPSTDC